MKQISILLLFCFASKGSISQNPSFKQGQQGLGFAHTILQLCWRCFSRCLHRFIQFQYRQIFVWYEGTLSYFIIGLRGIYHIPLYQKVDTYIGAILGYNSMKKIYAIDNILAGTADKTKTISYTLVAGANYKFSKKIGVFGEVGLGIVLLNFGLEFKL